MFPADLRRCFRRFPLRACLCSFANDLRSSVAGHTMSCRGGFSDFFLAKFGVPCNCILPVAAFTQSISGSVINLHYTGTATAVDSVVWDYGNGLSVTKTGSAISIAFSYTYPADGTYLVCARVYSECGSDRLCKIITIAGTGIAATAMEPVNIYPNPAGDEIRIDGIPAGTTLQLFDMMGKAMTGNLPVTARQAVSLRSLPAGVYQLVLSSRDAAARTFRLIKK